MRSLEYELRHKACESGYSDIQSFLGAILEKDGQLILPFYYCNNEFVIKIRKYQDKYYLSLRILFSNPGYICDFKDLMQHINQLYEDGTHALNNFDENIIYAKMNFDNNTNTQDSNE